MEQLKLERTLREWSVPGGVLRCNPADPNLYARFLSLAPQLTEIEQQLQKNQGDILQALQLADRKMKSVLAEIFPGNDFDSLLQGVNLLAVSENGQRVITNLLEALQPVLIAGAELCASQTAQAAVDKAKARREKK